MIIIKYCFGLVFDYFRTITFRLKNDGCNKSLIKLIEKRSIKIRSNTYYRYSYRVGKYVYNILHLLCLIFLFTIKKGK